MRKSKALSRVYDLIVAASVFQIFGCASPREALHVTTCFSAPDKGGLDCKKSGQPDYSVLYKDTKSYVCSPYPDFITLLERCEARGH